MVSTRQQCSGAASTGASCSSGTSVLADNMSGGCPDSLVLGNRSTSSRNTKGDTAQHTVQNKLGSRNDGARPTSLMDLPEELLDQILGYLRYKEVAAVRRVCVRMNAVCGSRLNMVFFKLQNEMLVRFQSIKAQMPRRESARRQHPLACEWDIIETLHMRLSLLNMTFGKHIERKHCCFFAGEVLDEVYRILHYIKVTSVLARPYKVTDELFDLTSMAMEYFKEKIEPTLPEITYFKSDLLDFGLPRAAFIVDGSPKSPEIDEDSIQTPPQPQTTMVLRKRIRKITRGMRRYNTQLTTLKRELKTCKTKMADQQKTIIDYSVRLDDNDRKSEEMSRKFSALLQELNKCKTELQYWRSKSPLNNLCGSCGNPVSTLPKEDFEALSNQGVVISMEVDPSVSAMNGNLNVEEDLKADMKKESTAEESLEYDQAPVRRPSSSSKDTREDFKRTGKDSSASAAVTEEGSSKKMANVNSDGDVVGMKRVSKRRQSPEGRSESKKPKVHSSAESSENPKRTCCLNLRSKCCKH